MTTLQICPDSKNALDHIHIFKTNIGNENLREVKKIFGRNRAISQWNVDTEDCDLVLRVVSHELSETEVMRFVRQYGFECEILA